MFQWLGESEKPLGGAEQAEMKQKALFMALTDKLENNSLVIVDNLEFAEYKTKKFNTLLSGLEKKVLLNDRRDILVINESHEEKAKYSSRNLQGVKIINLENINLVDLLNYKNQCLAPITMQYLFLHPAFYRLTIPLKILPANT